MRRKSRLVMNVIGIKKAFGCNECNGVVREKTDFKLILIAGLSSFLIIKGMVWITWSLRSLRGRAGKSQKLKLICA